MRRGPVSGEFLACNKKETGMKLRFVAVIVVNNCAIYAKINHGLSAAYRQKSPSNGRTADLLSRHDFNDPKNKCLPL